jgi:hypothetical protein
MEALALVRDFGIPLALLIAAVAALWRAWRLERRLRERDLADRHRRLSTHEQELYGLYRKLALRELGRLANNRQTLIKGIPDERSDCS